MGNITLSNVVLRQHEAPWSSIEVLAGRLLEPKHLTGRQVIATIRQARRARERLDAGMNGDYVPNKVSKVFPQRGCEAL